MASQKLNFKVLPNESGVRLDAFLVKRHPAYSRNQWSGLIRGGRVLINSQSAKASHLLKRGQLVKVDLSTVVPTAGPKIKLSIIHQDKDLLVINKPAGLVMHPAGRHQTGTLLDIAEDSFPEVYLVHRLDKDTSGVVLLAKNISTRDHLAKLFANRQVHKTYQALLVGQLKPKQAYLDLPIKRGRSGKFEVMANGRSAKSFYRVLEYLPGFSFVEVLPESGRTHQIRVHFKALGRPVAGDAMYGEEVVGLSRQFLHAATIEFTDVRGKARNFSAPLPADLKLFLNELRQK